MFSTSKSCDSCSDCVDSNLENDQNIKYNFVGEVDEDGLRKNYGYQTWNGRYNHEYAGDFFLNNMHHKGFYFMRKEKDSLFFDGQFYNNKLEGYGQVIHGDGSFYEGLFKDNKRFGPGILTYTDGSQDVGFWNGNGMIRLSISLSSEFIPTLCNSSYSKAKILRFKKIVPALPEKHDQGKDMIHNLRADDHFSHIYPQLYNNYVRNENSLFFDRRFYDLAQLGSEVALIDVLEDESMLYTDIDETMSEYDDPCLCTNERCIHINRLIDEINSEHERIKNNIVCLKKQLQICADCCSVEGDESGTVFSEEKEIKKDDTVLENIKQAFGMTETNSKTDVSSKYTVQKDWNQMGLQSSILELNEPQNDVPIMTNAAKEEEKVNTNETECKTSVKSNTSIDNDKVQLLKEPCECTEKNIFDIDVIISDLEDLEKIRKFHENVLEYLQNILCKEITRRVRPDTPKTLQVLVQHLLAWNNDQKIIDMMQHCFRYRNFENILSFNVKSLLSGNRSLFGRVGKQEKLCIDFLKHCGLNKLNAVKEALMKYNVNPDLSDARGNSGLHFAVTNNSCEVIRQLANFGANLDAFNDECLTPLLLSMLRYIAAINKVVSWESAFLPEVVLNSEELDEVVHWRPHESLVNLRDFMGSSTHLIRTDLYPTRLQSKSVDEISIRSRVSQSRKSSTARFNLSYLFSTMFTDDYVRFKKASAIKKFQEIDSEQVGPIENTIYTLLQFGADPNVGEVPMYPILLSIFTKNVDLVEVLLEKGGNPNIITDEGLTALHILAGQPFNSTNVNISEKFLEYCCDPNIKSQSDFWFEPNDELMGHYSEMNEVKEQGKTALQMICMRKDFDSDNVEYQCNLVRVLIENGAISHHHYYLGHTLLSIAVFRENVRLIETLYPYVEGKKPLGFNMGNILTVPGLKRFSPIRSFVQCKEVIELLICLGMNPFDPVYNFANVFEFFAKEYAEDVIEDKRNLRSKVEAEYRKLSKSFTSYDVLKNKNKVAVAYIKEIGRTILSKTYQYQVIKHLLVLAEEDYLNNNHAKSKAKLLTVEDAIKCIKLLIHHENIELNTSLKQIILKVLEYVKACNPAPKKPNKKRGKKESNKKEPLKSQSQHKLNLQDVVQKLTEYDEVISNEFARYVLDITNPEKYEVCYHCLKRSGKKLVTCPLCGIGKFCSDLCNKFNKQTMTKHPCNILFYNNPSSKKFELLEFSNNSAKENMRGRRATLEPQKQKFEKNVRRKSIGSSESIKQVNRINEVKFDLCCVEKNSSSKKFYLCEENKYWKSVKQDCDFLCGRQVTEGENDTRANSEFCVCYDQRSVEQSESKKLEELSCNGELQKVNFIEEETQKIANLRTNLDILTDNFNKFLERFKKKPPEDLYLEYSQMTEQMNATDSKKLGIQVNQHSNANDKSRGVIGLDKQIQGYLKKISRPPAKIKRKIYTNKLSLDDQSKNVGKYKKSQSNESESKACSVNRDEDKREGDNEKIKAINSKNEANKKQRSNFLDKENETDKFSENRTITRNTNRTLTDNTGEMLNQKENKSKQEVLRQRRVREALERELLKGDFNEESEKNKIVYAWIKNRGKGPRKRDKTISNKVEEQKVPYALEDPASPSLRSNLSKFKKFPKLHQYFLELLAQYFPQFNLNGLLFPFACFVDGQLYYKFAETSPYYCRTYSTV